MNNPKSLTEFPKAFVTAPSKRTTMKVVDATEEFFILENEDHTERTVKPRYECKIETVSFMAPIR